jgi:hypothetical protein
MSKLLLPTSSIVLRIDGIFDLPEQRNSKTITIKKLIDILQTQTSSIQYLGYDFEKPFPENDTIENCLMLTIHVIEDPLDINYDLPASDTIQHFLKQLKKNSSRILLQSSRSAMGKQERSFEFYVRGYQEPHRSYQSLRQA